MLNSRDILHFVSFTRSLLSAIRLICMFENPGRLQTEYAPSLISGVFLNKINGQFFHLIGKPLISLQVKEEYIIVEGQEHCNMC